jgi:hypothetical protein
MSVIGSPVSGEGRSYRMITAATGTALKRKINREFGAQQPQVPVKCKRDGTLL